MGTTQKPEGSCCKISITLKTPQGALWPPLKRAVTDCKQMVRMGPLFMLRCDRIPVMLTWFRKLSFSNSNSGRTSGYVGTSAVTGLSEFTVRPAVTRHSGRTLGVKCKSTADRSARNRKRWSEKCRLRSNRDCHQLPPIRQQCRGPAESARELPTFWFLGCSLRSG
jgi:hypothetical protein